MASTVQNHENKDHEMYWLQCRRVQFDKTGKTVWRISVSKVLHDPWQRGRHTLTNWPTNAERIERNGKVRIRSANVPVKAI